MTRTLPLVEIKAHLSEIVDGIEHQHDRVVLTRNGRPAAVMLSPDDLEALEDTLDILSNPNWREEFREAEAAIDRGDYMTGEELAQKYLKK